MARFGGKVGIGRSEEWLTLAAFPGKNKVKKRANGKQGVVEDQTAVGNKQYPHADIFRTGLCEYCFHHFVLRP